MNLSNRCTSSPQLAHGRIESTSRTFFVALHLFPTSLATPGVIAFSGGRTTIRHRAGDMLASHESSKASALHHTASAAASRRVAPPPTTTAAAEAFAKIVWRRPLVLQDNFSSLQVRLANEVGGNDPASTGDPLDTLAGLQSAALSAKSRKADPEPCSDTATRKLAHDAPRRAQRAPAANTHDLPQCCSPTCDSSLCCGCPEEHTVPTYADSDYDSETSSDMDGEDGEDDA